MKTQKTWFITGASRGFGLDITKAVLESGDKVVAAVRSNPESLKNSLGNPENLLVVKLDVTNEEQAKDAVRTAIENFGKIDVLVNNAGYGLLAGVEEATATEVRNNYEVNVFGVLNVTRAVLPSMRQNGSGHIINISSVGGLSAYFGWGVYGSTKFAVEGLTEALAAEIKPLGLYATVVAPGFFRTDFLDENSLTRTVNVIEDYKATVGEMRNIATNVNHNQPGDPKKLAQAFIKVAASENPPVHLLLGSDTLERFTNKISAFNKEIEEWRDVILSTDHDDVTKS